MMNGTYEHIKERQAVPRAENGQKRAYSEKCARKELNIFRLEMHPLYDPLLCH
jgi:hypothetical protein